MKKITSFLLALFLITCSLSNVNASELENNTNYDKVADYIKVELDDETSKDLETLEGWGADWMHVAFKEKVWGLRYYEMGFNHKIRNTHSVSPANMASIDIGKGFSKAQIVVPLEGSKEYNPVDLSVEKVKKGYWFPRTYEVLVLKVSKRVDNIELLAPESVKIGEDIRIQIKNDENKYFANSINKVFIGENEITDFDLGKDSIKIYGSAINEAGEYDVKLVSDFYDDKVVKVKVEKEELLDYAPILSLEKNQYRGWWSSYNYYTIEFEDKNYIDSLTSIFENEQEYEKASSLTNNKYKVYSDKIELRADDSNLTKEDVVLKFVADGYKEQVVTIKPDLSFIIGTSEEDETPDLSKKDTPVFNSAELKYVPAGWLSSEYSYYLVNFEGEDIADYLENIESVTVGEITYKEGYPSDVEEYDVDKEVLKLGMAGFVDGEDVDVWIESKGYKNLHFVIAAQKDKTAPIVAEVKVKLMPITTEVAPQVLEQYFTNLKSPNMESAKSFFADLTNAEYYLKPFKEMDKIKVMEIAKYFRPAYARFAFDGSDEEIDDYLDNVEKLIVNGTEYDYKPILATDMINDIIGKFPENTATSLVSAGLSFASSEKAYFYAEKDGVPFNPSITGATNLGKKAYYMDLSASHFTSSGLGTTSVVIKAKGYQDVVFDFNAFVGAKNYDVLGESPDFEEDDAVFVEDAMFSDYCRISFTGDEATVNNYLLQINEVKVGETTYKKHSSLAFKNSYMLSKGKVDVLAPYRYLDLDMDAFEAGKATTITIKARGYEDMELIVTRPEMESEVELEETEEPEETTTGESTEVKTIE